MLRFLDLGDINPFGNYKQPLRKLNWLSYHGNYPLNIPSDLHSTKLVVVDMSNSSITERWPGWTSTKVLENVEVLNLTSCHQLGRIPDFTPFKLMEKLILEDCLEIIKVEGSILSLTTLKSLSLKNCSKLRELPEDLSSLSNLEELIIDGTHLQEISISEGMQSLMTLSAQRCRSLTQIPDSRNFMKLQHLLLNYCGSLKDIPVSIGYWKSLEELNISHTGVRFLPESIKNLINLKVLDISLSAVSCKNYK
ncbi:hypothetical protein SAY86_027679 [Trapa natans]|uniref:Uncharacterized protein n=1 Tax=Trapa natans TaxID=22666 RepID=A0AAN7KR76_TRANT|nr:hypothetical protein SAY86_027679 [Trapa natans]